MSYFLKKNQVKETEHIFTAKTTNKTANLRVYGDIRLNIPKIDVKLKCSAFF